MLHTTNALLAALTAATGDDTPVRLYLTIAGVAAVLIILCIVLGIVSKRHKK